MKSKLRSVLHALLYFYAVLCGLLIYSWPLNKYEWMLDEADAVANGLTFCRLPIDHNAESTSYVAFLLIAVYAIVAGILTFKPRKPYPMIVVVLLLFLLWIGKFFLFAPDC